MKTVAAFVVALFGIQAVLALPHSMPNLNAPELPGAHVHGDILLTAEQEAYYFGGKAGRTGLIETFYRWPNNNIPVELVGLDATQSQIVWEALADMETKICITFSNRTTEQDFVFVTSSEAGCWSWVGRLGGGQQLNLDPDCYHEVVVQHEFIHALGFFHMQSAYDRDDYVRIIWENIIPGMEHNFDKLDKETTSQFGLAYDYYSIMHYPGWAFSVNGEDTIVAIQEGVSLDYRWVMTDIDNQRINNMYCPAKI